MRFEVRASPHAARAAAAVPMAVPVAMRHARMGHAPAVAVLLRHFRFSKFTSIITTVLTAVYRYLRHIGAAYSRTKRSSTCAFN